MNNIKIKSFDMDCDVIIPYNIITYDGVDWIEMSCRKDTVKRFEEMCEEAYDSFDFFEYGGFEHENWNGYE